jgi:hypothetical protein
MKVSALTPGVDETAERSVDGVLSGARHAYIMRDARIQGRGRPGLGPASESAIGAPPSEASGPGAYLARGGDEDPDAGSRRCTR